MLERVSVRLYLVVDFERPSVDAALAAALASSDPAPGPLVRTADDPGARLAAERAVALRVQRIYGHLVERQVLPDLAFVPDQDRVQLDQAFVTHLDLLEVGARAS